MSSHATFASRLALQSKLLLMLALRYIAFADALVSTSLDEGSPTVVREARALGTRVIAFPAGDLAEKSKKDLGITLVHDDAAFVAALRANSQPRT